MSPYAYVSGSPLEATDPSGMLKSWIDIGRGFMPFCTEAGNCLTADGSFTHPEGPDEFALPAGSGGTSFHLDIQFVAVMSDGTQVPCSEIESQCREYLDANKDLLMSRPDLRAQINADIAAAAPVSSVVLGYSVEVGGWCSATGCSVKVSGAIFGVALGNQPADAILGWHSHPNAGLLVLPQLDPYTWQKCAALPPGPCKYDQVPSAGDFNAYVVNGYTVPMYVLSPGSVYRYQVVNGKHQQKKVGQ